MQLRSLHHLLGRDAFAHKQVAQVREQVRGHLYYRVVVSAFFGAGIGEDRVFRPLCALVARKRGRRRAAFRCGKGSMPLFQKVLRASHMVMAASLMSS
jgi:hypothetical protein